MARPTSGTNPRRCESEERAFSSSGVYDLPNHGKLIYAGLMGLIPVLHRVRKDMPGGGCLNRIALTVQLAWGTPCASTFGVACGGFTTRWCGSPSCAACHMLLHGSTSLRFIWVSRFMPRVCADPTELLPSFVRPMYADLVSSFVTHSAFTRAWELTQGDAFDCPHMRLSAIASAAFLVASPCVPLLDPLPATAQHGSNSPPIQLIAELHSAV